MTSPLWLLHGLLGQPSSWSAVRERLDHGIETTAWRLPGHGPAPRPYEHLTSWSEAIDSLLEELPPEPVSLCAYSLGARVALGLAVRAPRRVARAFLIGAHPGLDDGAERAERARWDDEQARRVEEEGMASFVSAWEELELFDSQRELPPSVQDEQRRQRRDHRAPAVAWAMRTLGLGRMPSFWPELARLDVPVVWIAGARDQKFRRIAEEAASAGPSHRVATAPAAGHNVALEAPGWLADFLSSELHTEKGGRR